MKQMTYWKAFNLAMDMMDQVEGLEPTSALKQAASDCGIQYGEDMKSFVEWAYSSLDSRSLQSLR